MRGKTYCEYYPVASNVEDIWVINAQDIYIYLDENAAKYRFGFSLFIRI